MEDVTEIEGVTPSADIRAQLAAEGQPVLLAFSRGKDSIAAWLALRDAGVKVIPYFMYGIPGLRFVEQSLAYFEKYFDQHIMRLPHPSLMRKLANYCYQPPERIRVIRAANIPIPGYEDVVAVIREAAGLPPEAWVIDGVRAADSPQRRLAMASHGPVNHTARKVHAVWDWRKQHVMHAINLAGVRLPIDYQWFGRSFDGIDERFLRPLRDYAPDDYARVLEWFPLADLQLMRAEIGARLGLSKKAA